MAKFKVGNVQVGDTQPTVFIAEIASNHDGQLERAKRLCSLAKESCADILKLQHFRADTIVSDYGFSRLGAIGHHAKWGKSVYEMFKAAETPEEWTEELANHCREIDIEFMSSPYDFWAVDHLKPYVNAYKIGSGEIDNLPFIAYIVAQDKPVFIATGASSMDDVERAMDVVTNPVCLMQCNTNYTGSNDNYDSVNLRVLDEFKRMYPYAVIGLSDHTVGHAAVLGAVTLGARVIEKHFTDNPARSGPDHAFSTTPAEFAAMVRDVRRLEAALGDGRKKVEANERETVILQRRCVRATRRLSVGTLLAGDMVTCLRPAPEGSMPPYRIKDLIGRTLSQELEAGEHITTEHLK